MKQLGEILEKNGFVYIEDNQYMKGRVVVTLEEHFFSVEHWDEDFKEWLTWYSDDVLVYTLVGYLSWMGFIERGYNK